MKKCLMLMIAILGNGLNALNLHEKSAMGLDEHGDQLDQGTVGPDGIQADSEDLTLMGSQEQRRHRKITSAAKALENAKSRFHFGPTRGRGNRGR